MPETSPIQSVSAPVFDPSGSQMQLANQGQSQSKSINDFIKNGNHAERKISLPNGGSYKMTVSFNGITNDADQDKFLNSINNDIIDSIVNISITMGLGQERKTPENIKSTVKSVSFSINEKNKFSATKIFQKSFPNSKIVNHDYYIAKSKTPVDNNQKMALKNTERLRKATLFEKLDGLFSPSLKPQSTSSPIVPGQSKIINSTPNINSSEISKKHNNNLSTSTSNLENKATIQNNKLLEKSVDNSQSLKDDNVKMSKAEAKIRAIDELLNSSKIKLSAADSNDLDELFDNLKEKNKGKEILKNTYQEISDPFKELNDLLNNDQGTVKRNSEKSQNEKNLNFSISLQNDETDPLSKSLNSQEFDKLVLATDQNKSLDIDKGKLENLNYKKSLKVQDEALDTQKVSHDDSKNCDNRNAVGEILNILQNDKIFSQKNSVNKFQGLKSKTGNENTNKFIENWRQTLKIQNQSNNDSKKVRENKDVKKIENDSSKFMPQEKNQAFIKKELRENNVAKEQMIFGGVL